MKKKKNECAVFAVEIFLCGCFLLHEKQMKQGVTCLLCFVVGVSRSNLLSSSFKFVLVFTRNFRLNEIRPLKSSIPIYISFLPLLMVALVRKVLFHHSKINFSVFAPPCDIFYVFVCRKKMIV